MSQKRKHYISSCEHCGIDFECNTRKKKFCSPDCVSLSARLSPLEKIARANERWLKDKPKKKGPALTFGCSIRKINDSCWYAQ